MQIDHQEAMVILDEAEALALLDPTRGSAKLLAAQDPRLPPYATFRDKLLHVLDELHHETDRTILIWLDEDEIGRYNDVRDLEFDDDRFTHLNQPRA